MMTLLCAGCTSDWAITRKGFAAHLSALDLRRDIRSATASDARTSVEKQCISPEFAEALPGLLQAAVTAALVCAGVGTAPALLKAATSCPIPGPVEEVLDDD